jgi:hypothetical protein
MGRTKEREKIIHKPSTHEIFLCLSWMQVYAQILLNEKTNNKYSDLLAFLVNKRFYEGERDKITIKRIAADLNTKTVDVTKWLVEIYDDIFTLNDEKPELFEGNGIKTELYFRYYDNHCGFTVWLQVLPREFETFSFWFVKAKMGVERFWVKKVEYNIENNITTITIWLEGGLPNRYREFAVEKALFRNDIGFMDVYQKQDFEIDDELKKMKY